MRARTQARWLWTIDAEFFSDGSGRISDFIDRAGELILAHAKMLAPVPDVVIVAHIDFAAVRPLPAHPNVDHDASIFSLRTSSELAASNPMTHYCGRLGSG